MSVWRLICQILFNTSAEAVLTASREDYATLWHELAPVILTAPEMVAAMEAVHGGRRFAGVTEADVTRARRRHLLESAILAAQSAFSRDEAAGDIESAFAGELGGW